MPFGHNPPNNCFSMSLTHNQLIKTVPELHENSIIYIIELSKLYDLMWYYNNKKIQFTNKYSHVAINEVQKSYKLN